MTKSMRRALNEMRLNSNFEAYIHMSTAWALEDRGFVAIGGVPRGSITESGNFPQWLVSLTEKVRLTTGSTSKIR